MPEEVDLSIKVTVNNIPMLKTCGNDLEFLVLHEFKKHH